MLRPPPANIKLQPTGPSPPKKEKRSSHASSTSLNRSSTSIKRNSQGRRTPSSEVLPMLPRIKRYGSAEADNSSTPTRSSGSNARSSASPADSTAIAGVTDGRVVSSKFKKLFGKSKTPQDARWPAESVDSSPPPAGIVSTEDVELDMFDALRLSPELAMSAENAGEVESPPTVPKKMVARDESTVGRFRQSQADALKALLAEKRDEQVYMQEGKKERAAMNQPRYRMIDIAKEVTASSGLETPAGVKRAQAGPAHAQGHAGETKQKESEKKHAETEEEDKLQRKPVMLRRESRFKEIEIDIVQAGRFCSQDDKHEFLGSARGGRSGDDHFLHAIEEHNHEDDPESMSTPMMQPKSGPRKMSSMSLLKSRNRSRPQIESLASPVIMTPATAASFEEAYLSPELREVFAEIDNWNAREKAKLSMEISRQDGAANKTSAEIEEEAESQAQLNFEALIEKGRAVMECHSKDRWVEDRPWHMLTREESDALHLFMQTNAAEVGPLKRVMIRAFGKKRSRAELRRDSDLKQRMEKWESQVGSPMVEGFPCTPRDRHGSYNTPINDAPVGLRTPSDLFRRYRKHSGATKLEDALGLGIGLSTDSIAKGAPSTQEDAKTRSISFGSVYSSDGQVSRKIASNPSLSNSPPANSDLPSSPPDGPPVMRVKFEETEDGRKVAIKDGSFLSRLKALAKEHSPDQARVRRALPLSVTSSNLRSLVAEIPPVPPIPDWALTGMNVPPAGEKVSSQTQGVDLESERALEERERRLSDISLPGTIRGGARGSLEVAPLFSPAHPPQIGKLRPLSTLMSGPWLSFGEDSQSAEESDTLKEIVAGTDPTGPPPSPTASEGVSGRAEASAGQTICENCGGEGESIRCNACGKSCCAKCTNICVLTKCQLRLCLRCHPDGGCPVHKVF